MLYIRKRALAALASAAWSGPAGGAENLGYMSLQHYNWVLFLARLGSAGGSVGAVAAADAADAAAAAAVAAAGAALAPTSPSSANSSRRTWPSSVSSPYVRHNLRCHQPLHL